MDNDSKVVLEQLADRVLPIKRWLAEKALAPPDSEWRKAGSKQSINELNVVARIDAILASPEPDDIVADQWIECLRDPTAVQRDLLRRSRWRASRRTKAGERLLHSDAVFGASGSNNFILTAEAEVGGHPVVVPLTRREMYRKCLPPLVAAAKARRLLEPDMPKAAWDRFYDDMQIPTGMPDWALGEFSSLEFLRQFTRDCLELGLGMRGLLPEQLERTMLLEAGESRRPGNNYTPQNVSDATAAVKRALGL
jgi:hypothetical protein